MAIFRPSPEPMFRFHGDFLLSPTFIIALSLILINDFYLKPFRPSFLSGILSDLAGMIFFPIFFVAISEVLISRISSNYWARPRTFLVAALVVAGAFVFFKYIPVGSSFYDSMWERFDALLSPIVGLPGSGLVPDPWDLLALLIIPVPYLVGLTWRPRRIADIPPT